VREGITRTSCALASSFTSSKEKWKKKGFPHKEDEGTKWAKGLFRFQLPSLLGLLGVKKNRRRRRRAFLTKKTKRQSARRDCYSSI